MYLVAGGAGFLGETLVKKLLSQNKIVRSFDLNHTNIEHPNLEVVTGDVTNSVVVDKVLEGVEVVFNNIAQVPIAKNKELFWSVNEGGTKNLLESSLKNGIRHFVYTSSSAIYGAPNENPVSEKTLRSPAEEYGRAKLAGELQCQAYLNKGLNCSIIRPRTILGTGRLGIFQILFEWIRCGNNIPVLGNGDNIYQFVHADDLANAIILSSNYNVKSGIYNCGTDRYGTMRQMLESLCDYAGTGSTVKNFPFKLAVIGMKASSILRLSPLGSYHSLVWT